MNAINRLTELTAAAAGKLTTAEWMTLNGSAIFEGWTTEHYCNELENALRAKAQAAAVDRARRVEAAQVVQADFTGDEMYYKLLTEVERSIALDIELLAALRALPKLEGIAHQQTFMPGEVILCMPYDLDMLKRNVSVLESAGFEWNHDMSIQPHCGEIMTVFRRGNVVIHLNVDPDYAGSTCKKSVIAYEQKAVYEVTCLEA